MAILSCVELYGARADHANRVGHVYYIAVLVRDGLLDDRHEGIVHVSVLDGRGLEVGNVPMLLAPCLDLLPGDLAVVLVALVAHDDEGEVVGVGRTGVIDEAIAPLLDGLEGFFLCQVEGQHAAVGSPIKRIPNRLVLLLSGRVPNLYGDNSILNHNLLLLEIRPNGRLRHCWRLALRVPQQEGCFADVGVAQHYNFQKILLCRVHIYPNGEIYYLLKKYIKLFSYDVFNSVNVFQG